MAKPSLPIPLVLWEFTPDLYSKNMKQLQLYIHGEEHDHALGGGAGADLAPDSLEVSTRFAWKGWINPAQITADQNNYFPAGLQGATVLRLTSDAARSITGLAESGTTGRIFILLNVGSFDITLVDESGASTAENRFAIPGNVTMEPEEGLVLIYDTQSSRWRVFAKFADVHSQAHDHSNSADGTALVPESLEITGGPFALRGDLSPAQITASQNDYNPAGLADAAVLRLSSDAAWSITGLAGGADGRKMLVFNVGAFNVTLTDEDAASAAANRFALTGNRILTPDDGVQFWYDSTSARWRATN
jgi:hypothetical protein